MKYLILGGTAAAIATIAVAQAPSTAPTPHHGVADKVMTRDGTIAKVREHFSKMDANRDGFVTQEEMKEVRKEVREQRMERREKRTAMRDPNAAFDRLDSNKDGSISREEFAKGREMRIEKRVEMRGDGEHGGKHMMRMHRMGGGMGGHGMMMRMADADKDGKVSLAEAQAAAVRHFDMMDTNRDGQVTREERRAAHEKMRAMHAPKAS